MTHLSENACALKLNKISIHTTDELHEAVQDFNDVCMVILPLHLKANGYKKPCQGLGSFIAIVANNLGNEATLITIGEVTDLVQIQANIPKTFRYQNWIAIKRKFPQKADLCSLSNYHFGALIHTSYKKSLRHVKTRIEYTYCPTCNKTTKDYGGKKHTYHEYGTLMSDVWRDLACELEGDITPLLIRFQDLFGLAPYKKLMVLDCRHLDYQPISVYHKESTDWIKNFNTIREQTIQYPLYRNQASQKNIKSHSTQKLTNQILTGDCLELLKKIPDNSIDFVLLIPLTI
jgi:hypothetical protein